MSGVDMAGLLSKDVQSWYPWKKDGEGQPEQLIGAVVKVDRWTSDYDNGPVPVLEVDPVDDDKVLWRIVGYGAVLGRELKPFKVGDQIGIRYTGMVKAGTGRQDYPGFRVIRDAAEPDTETSSDVAPPPVDDVPPVPADVPVYGSLEPF